MNLVEKVKNVLLSPKTEWEKSVSENTTFASLLTGYVAPLAVLGAIAAFIGYGFIGYSVLGVKIVGMQLGIALAISTLLNPILSYVIVTYVVNMLAPSFQSENNLDKSARLVAYSQTAGLVASLFSIIPAISFLGIIGLYGLYIAWIGLPIMKNTPNEKKVTYVVAIIVVAIIANIALSFVLDIVMKTLGLPTLSSAVMGSMR
ncbi:MAG: Yip1 family protein [Thermonemataceae bacterium]|nr:Yip1 family protein [Thermonemataceae bacterium]